MFTDSENNRFQKKLIMQNMNIRILSVRLLPYRLVLFYFENYIRCDYSYRKEISEIKDGGLEIVEEGPLRVSVKVYIDV